MAGRLAAPSMLFVTPLFAGLLTILAVAFVAAIAVGTGQSVLLDIAFVVALVSFLGTVAFARYLERRGR